MEQLSQDDTIVGSSQELVNEYCAQFCELYKNEEFRHQYSGISRKIYGSTAPQSEDDLSHVFRRADRLVTNLGTLQDYIEGYSRRYFVSDAQSIVGKFGKLYDHVNLEHSRLLLLESPYHAFDSIQGELGELGKTASGLEDTVHLLGQNAERIDAQLRTSQKDYIAILAIFAAVIMAFSGGFGFLSSSLGALTKVDLLKLVCAVSAVGLVLVDLLYVLLRFVWGIIRQDKLPSGIPNTTAVLVVCNVLLFFLCIGSFLLTTDIAPLALKSSV